MARPIWTGSISFGLVNVPVKVYSAVRQQDLHFNQFDPNGNRIRYKRVSEKTGREVDYGDIVKGYEVTKGKYVMVDPEELEAFEPRATRTIDIEDFVDLDETAATRAKVSDREVKMASQIISSLTTKWDPKRYHDTYRERVEDYLAKKAKGETIEVEEAPAEPSKVGDLMAALEESLAAAKSKRSSASKRSNGSKRRTARKRPAAKGSSTTSRASRKPAAAGRRKSA